MTFDEAVAFALTLPGTELGTSYGKPAVKVACNGRAFLFRSHEPETSFGVALDLDSIEILKETDPATFWQTPHYVGSRPQSREAKAGPSACYDPNARASRISSVGRAAVL